MEVRFLLGLLSFGLSAYAYYPYFKKIKAGHAHPTISTWVGWLIIDFVILLGMIAKHEVAFQNIAYVIGCGAVLLACLQVRAPLGWWWLDTGCMALVMVAMYGWYASGDPEVAIVISVAAFLVSCAPMIINIHQKPEREPLVPWLISWAGATAGIVAIPKLDITNALSPITFFLLGLVVVVLILRKFRTRQQQSLGRINLPSQQMDR